jgi:hypothetical protein
MWLQIILALLSAIASNPALVMKILACLSDPKNATFAQKLACVVSATGGLTPGTVEFHAVEAIKHHLQAQVKAGATP